MIINGNNNNNILPGTNNADDIFGRGGNDTLLGRGGNDTLEGGNGNDVLIGGGGDDILIGGAGDSFLTGDGGQDSFKLDAVFGVRTAITDFSVANDTILINRSQFFVFDPVSGGVTNLPPGSLALDQFNIGAGPADNNDYFTYNPGTGELFFDRDGVISGPGFPTTLVAQLPRNLFMTNNDIVMV
jgi:serralysin